MSLKQRFSSSCLRAFLTTLCVLFIQSFCCSFIYALTLNGVLSYFLGYIALFLGVTLYKREELLEDLHNLKKDTHNKIILLIGMFVLFLILTYVSNIILYNMFGAIAQNEVSNRTLIKKNPLVMLIALGVFGPFIEEMAFRYPYRRCRANKTLKFFIYSLIFAAFHIIADISFKGLLYLIPYTFLSMAIGYGYYKTDNIFTAIISHIFNNIVAITLILL